MSSSVMCETCKWAGGGYLYQEDMQNVSGGGIPVHICVLSHKHHLIVEVG